MGFVKRAFDNITAESTDAILVDAVPGSSIKVRGLVANNDTAGSAITFNSKGDGAGTPISATFTNLAFGPVVMPDSENGWMETAVGEGLSCTTSAGATTGIQIIYEIRNV